MSESRAPAQLALEAINSYEMPEGQELSAVSLSWGLDERRTGREEAEETDKWLSALLDKACRPVFLDVVAAETLEDAQTWLSACSWAHILPHPAQGCAAPTRTCRQY